MAELALIFGVIVAVGLGLRIDKEGSDDKKKGKEMRTIRILENAIDRERYICKQKIKRVTGWSAFVFLLLLLIDSTKFGRNLNDKFTRIFRRKVDAFWDEITKTKQKKRKKLKK